MNQLAHFVDGRALESDSAAEARIEVRSPHTGRVIATIPNGREQSVDRAVAAAAAALRSWRTRALDERIGFCDALRERIERDQGALVEALVQEVGKPVRSARIEVRSLLASFEWFREAATRELGELETPSAAEPTLRIVREPIGVVAAITPFNFPALLLSWKLCPAVLTGCTLVSKPDPRTPLSTALLAEWSAEADWPPGVFNVVHGDAATGAALAAHPRVAKIAFTGSVAAGRAVYGLAAHGIKRVTLELGGCSPLVVCADADFDRAMGDVLNRAFYNSGQYCFRINRILVQRDRYDDFVAAFSRAAAGLVVGDPDDERTDLGPLIDRGSLDKVLERIDDAQRKGARVVLDGRGSAPSTGPFLGPTVLADVPPDARVMQDETFGPVVSIAPFDGIDEAIARANGTEYGLAAFALTGDPALAERLSRELEAGTVWVNALDRSCMDAPFGGVKQSGVGVEKSRWAFDEYLQPRAIYVDAAVGGPAAGTS